MKTLRTFSLALLFLSTAFTNATNLQATLVLEDIPAKTIVLKHPAAANIDSYFSGATLVSFEVYKSGSKEDLAKIVNSLKTNKNIASCSEGAVNGDFQQITITLKSAQNKAWFVAMFKTAGLNTIRVNNNPIVEVDKL